jgi:site-specific DNA-methyltransferase (adenine-specific)
MACAIEDAGFEIRDMIAWVYGSGFPKSLDVSKAIDKAAEREVVGTQKRSQVASEGWDRPWKQEAMKEAGGTVAEFNITAPATEAARQWQGWGTALKPSLEPITMARKPLIGTVAANVMEYGTGGINVDGCRVGTEEIEWKPRGESVTFGKTTFADRTGEVNKGRWPANLILSHSPECICTGVKRVKGSGWAQSGSKASDNKSMSGGNYARDPKPDAFADSFGYETVESYNCIEGCPVRLLDEQSGEDCFGDTGGASRFFYTAKADKSERRQSKHPTVKPLDLIRYLVRMVTPEGGVVLDPFLGSGTLCEAARAEHCLSIGIELDEAYCSDAVERLRQGVLF